MRSLNVTTSVHNIAESVVYCIAVTSIALVTILISTVAYGRRTLGVIGCWLYTDSYILSDVLFVSVSDAVLSSVSCSRR